MAGFIFTLALLAASTNALPLDLQGLSHFHYEPKPIAPYPYANSTPCTEEPRPTKPVYATGTGPAFYPHSTAVPTGTFPTGAYPYPAPVPSGYQVKRNAEADDVHHTPKAPVGYAPPGYAPWPYPYPLPTGWLPTGTDFNPAPTASAGYGGSIPQAPSSAIPGYGSPGKQFGGPRKPNFKPVYPTAYQPETTVMPFSYGTVPPPAPTASSASHSLPSYPTTSAPVAPVPTGYGQ